MKRLVFTLIVIAVVATPAFAQLRHGGAAWDGYVKRGRVRVRAGGSGWSVNGIPVSHAQELYESPDAARYVLSRLKGTMHPASEIAPNAGSVQFKVTLRSSGPRVAWVCGNDLHYIQTKLYSTAVAFLALWGFDHC